MNPNVEEAQAVHGLDSEGGLHLIVVRGRIRAICKFHGTPIPIADTLLCVAIARYTLDSLLDSMQASCPGHPIHATVDEMVRELRSDPALAAETRIVARPRRGESEVPQ